MEKIKIGRINLHYKTIEISTDKFSEVSSAFETFRSSPKTIVCFICLLEDSAKLIIFLSDDLKNDLRFNASMLLYNSIYRAADYKKFNKMFESQDIDKRQIEDVITSVKYNIKVIQERK